MLIGPLGTNFNLNKNSYIFIEENAFENAVCKMASISSWSQCVYWLIWLGFVTLHSNKVILYKNIINSSAPGRFE